MEGITEINKDDYIDNCLKIVKEMITEEDFSDEIWLALTGEIMDTCLFIGGDFAVSYTHLTLPTICSV